MELIFATHNAHKLEEIREAVPDFVKVMSLFDMGFSGEIPETGTTIAENASQVKTLLTTTMWKSCCVR